MAKKKKNKIQEAIEKAEKSEGYLIMVTRVNGDKLHHTFFTKEFPSNDIMTSLDEHAKLLEKEVE